MSNKNKTCEERIEEYLKSRIEDLKILFYDYNNGESYHDELGNFNEYGLAFDYVPLETFDDQEEPYFRYQLSFGGPSDEFRFFVERTCETCFYIIRVEYWFLDWFDGSSRQLENTDLELLKDIFNDFRELGLVESEYQKSIEY